MGCKKTFEGLGQAIREALDDTFWHILATTALELFVQIVLAWERPILLIVLLHAREHLIINLARLGQASHKKTGLFLIHIKPIFKRFHSL